MQKKQETVFTVYNVYSQKNSAKAKILQNSSTGASYREKFVPKNFLDAPLTTSEKNIIKVFKSFISATALYIVRRALFTKAKTWLYQTFCHWVKIFQKKVFFLTFCGIRAATTWVVPGLFINTILGQVQGFISSVGWTCIYFVKNLIFWCYFLGKFEKCFYKALRFSFNYK